MKKIEGGITAAKGFEAAGVNAGIKYKNRNDMALIFSERPCVAAGVFTTNVVKAAPVLWDRYLIDHYDDMHAVVINAGIANACTGEEGMDYCKKTSEAAGKLFNIDASSVAVASTGVIGMQLPIDRIVNGISLLKEAKGNTRNHGHVAAQSNVVKGYIYMMLRGKNILTLVRVLPLWGLDMETNVITMH